VTHIFLVYLANTWGDGLAEVAEKTAKDLGITVAGKFRIAEAAPDYSAEVSSLGIGDQQASRAGSSSGEDYGAVDYLW
jgi:hypothetical protein